MVPAEQWLLGRRSPAPVAIQSHERADYLCSLRANFPGSERRSQKHFQMCRAPAQR